MSTLVEDDRWLSGDARDAAVAIDPAARADDEGVRFPIATPHALTEAFAGAGLLDVRVDAIDVELAVS